MSMTKTAARGVELEPIDRLEEKVRALVTMVERMKAEQARAAEENQRLSRELDATRARLATSAVLAALNIADELFRCRDTGRARDGQLAERAGELERLLDRLLMA